MRKTLPTSSTRAANGDLADGAAPDAWSATPPVPAAARRLSRHSVPHLVLGMLLVLGCALGFLAVMAGSGEGLPVLVTARPVTVGQVLTAQDLRSVELRGAAEVRAVSATRSAELVGRPVMTSLPAGALLTPESVGGSAPPPGQAIVALALDVGRIPPEVTSGASVSVVTVPKSSVSGVPAAATRSWPAVVAAVVSPDATSAPGRTTVVSVQLEESAAQSVAAVPPDQISLVHVAAGG